MARRIMNRKELRANYDAAERQKTDDTEETEDEEGEEDDEEGEEEEGEEGEEGEADEGGDEDDEPSDDDDEDAPKKKKKKKVVKPAKVAKPKAKPRTRTAKVVRMRVVWGVFSNSNQRVATYEYPKKADADAHALRLTTDKKSTHFVQPVKEPIEEKKEE